jgi:anti-sigma regulatory factor (Ser/Thr protein kinase)
MGYTVGMALHKTLDNDPRAAGQARQAIAKFLDRTHLTKLSDDAQLLASELVTNAVRHARGPIDVRAYVRDGFLRLEVWDRQADVSPQPRTADDDAENGRGMDIVEKVSSRWGWRAVDGGKVVWIDLRL